MFILAFALSFVSPADACAMPRFEEVVAKPAQPVQPVQVADAKKAANAQAAQVPQPAQPVAPVAPAPKSLEDALAQIDAAGIPEMQAAPPTAVAKAE